MSKKLLSRPTPPPVRLIREGWLEPVNKKEIDAWRDQAKHYIARNGLTRVNIPSKIR